MPRIIGKIRGGLSGWAENREDSACAALSIAPGFFEKSGADYPATRNFNCPEVRSSQMWPRIFGKIRAGLSGLAGIREVAKCATRSTGPGLLEKSGLSDLQQAENIGNGHELGRGIKTLPLPPAQVLAPFQKVPTPLLSHQSSKLQDLPF